MELEILASEKLHDLYSVLNIRMIRSRRMRWAGQVACLGQKRNAYKAFNRKS
jgi:hypothetical protein